jgi:hypothetical protein
MLYWYSHERLLHLLSVCLYHWLLSLGDRAAQLFNAHVSLRGPLLLFAGNMKSGSFFIWRHIIFIGILDFGSCSGSACISSLAFLASFWFFNHQIIPLGNITQNQPTMIQEEYLVHCNMIQYNSLACQTYWIN